MKFNPANERIKHRYFQYLAEAKRLDEQTVDAAAKAIARFEVFTGYRSFQEFRADHASAYRAHLLKQENAAGKPLSKATVVHTLAALKRFFVWLAGQAGYKKIDYAAAEYFNPSLRDVAIARAHRERPVPTLDQVRRVILSMPCQTPVQRRDRALLALTALTGARDNAVASLKVKHVDPVERVLFQDGRDVRTKFGKTITTWFFPVGDELVAIIADWTAFLREGLSFGPEDPFFPASVRSLNPDERGSSLSNIGWETAGPIRRIFKETFEAAGMGNFNPHSFRHMLVRFGMDVCRKPEEFKSWSQNLGHEKVLVTFNSYGDVPAHRQRELINSVGEQTADDRLALELGYAALAAARRAGKVGT